jgi:hypothetical protein
MYSAITSSAIGLHAHDELGAFDRSVDKRRADFDGPPYSRDE